MPEAIRVAPWPDPVLDVIGHDPRSWYAETFWLPTLGPTALLLLRHLADRFELDPAGLELAAQENDTTIAVRRALPPVHRRHVRRLPVPLQARHAEWVAEQSAKPLDLARRRARRFALTLLAQGESLDGVERALHAGGFHPALAHEAVRWAREQTLPTDQESLPATGPPPVTTSPGWSA